MGSNNRLRRTALSAFAGRLLNALRQIVSVPILVAAWGASYYGEWLVLSSIPTFLAMSNLGLGTAASVQISFDVRNQEYRRAWSLLKGANHLLLLVLLLVTLLVWLLLAQTNLLGSTVTRVESPIAIVLSLVGAAVCKMLAGTLRGWWNGVGNPSVPIRWANLSLVSELSVVVGVGLLGGTAMTLAQSLLAVTVLWYVSYFLATVVRAKASLGSIQGIPADYYRAAGLVRVGLGHQLTPLWQAILFQGSIVLAATALDSASAALWGAMRIVVRSGCQLIEVMRISLGPEFQLAFADDDRDKLRLLHSASVLLSIALTLVAAAVLLVCGLPLFEIWTSHEFEVGFSEWSVLVISLIPLSIWWVSAEFQLVINRPWFSSVAGVLTALLALGAMWLLSNLGILGFCIGYLLFDCVMAVAVIAKSLAILDTTLAKSCVHGLSFLASKGQILVLDVFSRTNVTHRT
ncbi:MAG: hypothetical protein AAGD07_01900 [Planctomycetota bacterium]